MGGRPLPARYSLLLFATRYSLFASMKQDVSPVSRPLDAAAAALAVVLCLSWGFNQVAVKLALPEIPPLIQAAFRSTFGALVVVAWSRGARHQADAAGRHARSRPRRRAAVRARIHVDLPRARLHQRDPRRAVHLHRAVRRGASARAGSCRATGSASRNGSGSCCRLPASRSRSGCRRRAAMRAS